MISAENFSLVHQLGEKMMGEIIQFGPFCEKDNLLLLSAWFDARTEGVDSPAIFEDSVGRLIDQIDCTKFESKLVLGVLGKKGSRFSNSERCR